MIFLYWKWLSCFSPNRLWLYHHPHQLLTFLRHFVLFEEFLRVLSPYVLHVPPSHFLPASLGNAVTVSYWISEWVSKCLVIFRSVTSVTIQSDLACIIFSGIYTTYFLEFLHHNWQRVLIWCKFNCENVRETNIFPGFWFKSMTKMNKTMRTN